MTEEQNKLADEIDVLIGRLRMHAGASDTHIPRPLLASAADALVVLREHEPATEAVRDAALEEAAKVCEREAEGYRSAENHGMRTPVGRQGAIAQEMEARNCATLIRALKGKGASQGVDVMDALERSVKLQSHYAGLLNQYDGGERITFPNAAAWLQRLAEFAPDEQKG